MNKLFLKTLFTSCFLFTICSFIINFTVWIFSSNNQSRMLIIWANLLILLVCFIISFFTVHKNSKKNNASSNKLKFTYIAGIIYTLSFFAVNSFQYIIKKENFWNGYTLIILLIFGITSSILILKVKFKNYFASSLFNFFCIGIFYYTVFVIKANFSKGNSLIIVLGAYTMVYISSAVIYYLISKNRQQKHNAQKEYSNLFS